MNNVISGSKYRSRAEFDKRKQMLSLTYTATLFQYVDAQTELGDHVASDLNSAYA